MNSLFKAKLTDAPASQLWIFKSLEFGDLRLREVNLPWTRSQGPPDPCMVGGMLLEVLGQG